jgi:hypothetical protein
MPTITPVCRGRPTILGKTALGASSPAKPACIIEQQYYNTNTTSRIQMRRNKIQLLKVRVQQIQKKNKKKKKESTMDRLNLTFTIPDPLSHTRG